MADGAKRGSEKAEAETLMRRPCHWPVLAPPADDSVRRTSSATVSVVIAYYNRADVIRAAVESVLAQTVPADEIVICDDGSSDDLERALGDCRVAVRIVRKENGGFASALNAASTAARSEFVAQLDSDDVFVPQRIEAIKALAASRPDLDVIATDAFVEYEGALVARFNDATPFAASGQRMAILEGCFFAWPAIRRSVLLAAGGYDETLENLQDWECFIRLILDGAKIASIREPLYRWRLTPGSLLGDSISATQARMAFLPRLLARADLTPQERARIEQLAANAKVANARAHARRALLNGDKDARRRAVRLLATPKASSADRAKALAATIAPGATRRLLTGRIHEDPIREAFARRLGVSPPTLREAPHAPVKSQDVAWHERAGRR